MREVLGALLLTAAGVLLWFLGSHHGRTAERRLIAGGGTDVENVNAMTAYETELRRRMGLRRMHPDPANAGQVHRVRFRR